MLELVGKDSTLTGRTDLWAAVIDAVEQHPWLGYGMGAFWRGPLSEAIRAIPWHPRSAHSGYLELALDLGLCGAVLVLVPLLLNLRRAFQRGLFEASPLELWPPLYLTLVLALNIPRSGLLRPHDLNWALYVAAVVWIGSPSRAAASVPGEPARW